MKLRKARNLTFAITLMMSIALWFVEGDPMYPFFVGAWVGFFFLALTMNLIGWFGGGR